MLKASGQRVKAREIERFLNATGLAGGKEGDEALYAEYIFYKRAFFILLPVAMGLLFLVVLRIV